MLNNISIIFILIFGMLKIVIKKRINMLNLIFLYLTVWVSNSKNSLIGRLQFKTCPI